MTFSQTAEVSEIDGFAEVFCWSILLHQRRLTFACAYAITWPVYGCGFTYLGYPQKLKCENVRSDQSTKISLSKISHYMV